MHVAYGNTLRRFYAVCFSASEDGGTTSSHFAFLHFSRSLASSWLSEWIEPILTTVNVAAPYHARILLFKYIYIYICVHMYVASACTRGAMRAGESGMQRVSYILHGASTRVGLTCAFGCACTQRRFTSYNAHSAIRRSLQNASLRKRRFPQINVVPWTRSEKYKSVTNRKSPPLREARIHAEGGGSREYRDLDLKCM